MKLLNKFNLQTFITTYAKHFFPITLFLGLSLTIWILAPLLDVGNYYPFQDPGKRCYLIGLLLLMWALKIYLFDYAESHAAPLLPTEQQTKLATLQARFNGAVQFLTKTSLNKETTNTSLFQLPWYLLIGPQNSGKTTLLANANANYVLVKQFKQEDLKQLKPSDNCDWWVTRQAVLVDVPSNYILETKHRFLWLGLVDLIRRFRHKNPLNGVVITLNLPELIKQDIPWQNRSFMQPLRNHIQQLQQQFDPQLPFYLVITKCDLLPGFMEFFGDASIDESSQAWGITLPLLNANEKLADVFSQRFNALIKRLNKQLLPRLHHERNQQVRPSIKDFPLQIERMKESITHWLKALDIDQFNLQGVYLTSAIQTSTEEESAAHTTIHSHQSQNMLQILSQPAMPSRAFFIRQLLQQGLINTFEHTPVAHIEATPLTWQKRMTYTTGLSIAAIAVILLARDFQVGIHQAYALQHLLSEYQTSLQHEPTDTRHLITSLPLLNALQDATGRHGHQLSRFTVYTNKSQKTAGQIYHQALQTIVVPEIKNILETYLKSPANKNPDRLYSALKAYLMLNNSQTLETDFVLNTTSQLLPDTINHEQQAALINHMRIALTELQPIALNDAIVANTRTLLFNFSSLQLASIILLNIGNNNLASSIDLGTHGEPTPLLTTKQIVNEIPNLFTARYFQTTLSEQIPRAANEAIHGNEVLGQAPAATVTADEATLTEALSKQYIANYIDIWESLLANLQMVTPDNLTRTDAMLAAFSSNASPLMQLLLTMQQNTSFPVIASASPKLQALNNLLADLQNQQGILNQTFAGMKKLHLYLQPILHSSDINAATFTASKNRINSAAANDPINHLRSLAAENPEPIKTWLSQLADNSWRFMMQTTSEHIKNHWKTAVFTPYASLANRYPLKANAADEIELEQFSQFFKPQGTLVSFYQAFLKPFINESTKTWNWKNIDNQQVAISKNNLQQIQMALEVQSAFFPNNNDTLFVPFSLKPVSMDKDTHTVNLKINGQSFSYHKSTPRTPRMLTWPGHPTSHETIINFAAKGAAEMDIITPGDWAWFRLVHKAMQNPTTEKEKQLTLTFNINNHSAKYLLFTEGRVNPFAPLNLEKLQLPEELD